MVTCPRCGQTADETRQAACPTCGAPLKPLQAAPTPTGGIPGVTPPQAPMGAMPPNNPNARVSLTGEVIESAPTTAPPPNYVGGAGAPRMTKAGAGIAAQKKIDEERARNATLFRVASMFAFVLFLIGTGFWYLKLRTNPDAQMKQYFKAMSGGELATIYNLSDLSDDLKKEYPDSKAFEDKIRESAAKLPGGAEGLTQGLAFLSKNTKIGKAEISGGEATVQVTLTFGGAKQKTQYKLKNVWGTWKVEDDGAAVVGYLSKMAKGQNG